MSAKKSSCWKKLGCGCLVIVGAGLAFALVSVLSVVLNKPQDPDIGTIEKSESVGNSETQFTAGKDESTVKPVRLTLDMEMGRFEVTPGGDDGNIEVTGKYDQANFELTTDVVEKEKYIDYRVKFKSKRSLLGLMLANHNGDHIDNRLDIKLPRNLLYDLRFKGNMGEFNLDMTGLAVADADLEFSKGQMWVGMREANPVPMEKLKVKSSMGDSFIGDLQNLGPAKAEFGGTMGQMTVSNSGDLRGDMDVKFNMTMGEANLEVPENVELETATSAFMGESRQPKRSKSDNPTAKMKVRGSVTMGEHNVVYRSSNRSQSRQDKLLRTNRTRRFIDTDDFAGELQRYREAVAEDPEGNFLSEDDLNRLGYSLIERGRLPDAIEIFKLNVALNPEYANGYDSLGEGYMYAGETELAIKNYKKSLELDPGNQNGKHMLRKLQANKEEDP